MRSGSVPLHELRRRKHAGSAECLWREVRNVPGDQMVRRACEGDFQQRLVVRIGQAYAQRHRGDGLAAELDEVEQCGNRVLVEGEARPRENLLVL